MSARPIRDQDAERAFLGMLLCAFPEAIEAAKTLRPDDFAFDGSRQVFAAACVCLDGGNPPNIVEVVQELRRSDRLEDVGGAGELAGLMDTADIPRYAAHYAARIRQAALDWKLATANEALQNALLNGRDPERVATHAAEVARLCAAREQPSRRLPRLDLATPAAPIDWLLERILPRQGTLLLAGKPEAGKSWLAMHLAVCVAAGIPFLGRFAVRPGPVIYLDEEGNLTGTQQRVAMVARGLGLDPATLADRLIVSVRSGMRFDNPGMMAMLRAELEDVKPVLIIADAAIRMHKLDENAAADVSSLFRDALAPLQTAYGVSIVLLHHFRKRQQDDQAGDWEEWVRGSGDWGGAVDGILGVFKQDTGRRILRHGKPRWSEPMPSCYVAFGITADAASFTYEGDFSETRVIAADAEIEVWAYLNEAGGPPSGGRLTKEVEKHFEDQMSGRTVWGILKSLEGKGRARSEQEKNEGRGWRKRWFALVPGEARNA